MTQNDGNSGTSDAVGKIPEWARPGAICEANVENEGWLRGIVRTVTTAMIEVDLGDGRVVRAGEFADLRPILQRFDVEAAAVAARLRATGRGFLTMRKDELREAFGVGRFTEGQSNAVCEALDRYGVTVFPPPFYSGMTLRLYQAEHPIRDVADAVLNPDNVPETALRRAADVFARERSGRDLRSDDAPWLRIFDLFLQLVVGRQPEGWEDLRDDRHPSQVARELAEALGFDRQVPDDESTVRLAAAVCAFRPRRRRWEPAALVPAGWDGAAALPLVAQLETTNRALHERHEQLLREAAQLLLHAKQVPDRPVEVGLLGLRYCREDDERSF